MLKFEHPELFWIFLILLAITGLFIYRNKSRKRDLKSFADETIQGKLMQNFNPARRKAKHYLTILGLFFLSIAVVGPKVGKTLKKVERKGVDVIIAIDISNSMNAEDLAPSRLERVKYEATKFIDKMKGDRIGLVAFAGVSYLQCPLTLDYSAAKLFLDAISSDIIGVQGTAMADAVQRGIDAFKGDEKKHKVIVVISDGEDHEGKIAEVIKTAREKGIVIYSIGVGSYSGAPIPVVAKDGSIAYKKDRAGKVVTTALQENTMKEFASETGGEYYNLNKNNHAFEEMYEKIRGMEQKDFKTHEFSDYENRYQVFLAIGLILLIMEFFIRDWNKKNEEMA
ncbi:MAG: VWA domain-containing protein [Candidatus Marinimicrobia bacterium]|nr:VWA domain-containing protein [Candidatus Neomarinimicrobiota bacterium]